LNLVEMNHYERGFSR
ncbi:DUF3896 family protein, partial [Bacillus toyonensis]